LEKKSRGNQTGSVEGGKKENRPDRTLGNLMLILEDDMRAVVEKKRRIMERE